MVWAVREIDGKRATGLMAAFPMTETVTGALTSTWTGKPMSDGNMTCIGDKSMVFWKLIFNSVAPVRREVGSLMSSEVFMVMERKRMPVSANWKSPLAWKASDLMASMFSFSKILENSVCRERLISDLTSSSDLCPATLETTVESWSKTESEPYSMNPPWKTLM